MMSHPQEPQHLPEPTAQEYLALARQAATNAARLGGRFYDLYAEQHDLMVELAHQARRLELDAWLSELEEQGQAIRIRVPDLGAALYAHRLGQCAIQSLTHPSPSVRSIAQNWPRIAAHLARQALGLAEGS